MRLGLESAAGVDWIVRPTTPLPAEWQELDRSHPAIVPGEIHADLLAAQQIPDPFDGDNESAQAWIGHTDWSYAGPSPGRRTAETAARPGRRRAGHRGHLTLNGTVIGRTENQHRSYRFDLDRAAGRGREHADRRVRAPRPGRRPARGGDRRSAPHVLTIPFNAIRKMAVQLRLGLGHRRGDRRDLEGRSASNPGRGVRIASVRPLVEARRRPPEFSPPMSSWSGPTPRRDADDRGDRCHRSVITPRRPCVGRGTASGCRATVPDAWTRWWPRGYGEQRRYRGRRFAADGATWTRPRRLPHRRTRHRARRRRHAVHLRSTASRSTSAAPTGSPTTRSSPRSTRDRYRAAIARRRRRRT